jgi:hypothetical protein
MIRVCMHDCTFIFENGGVRYLSLKSRRVPIDLNVRNCAEDINRERYLGWASPPTIPFNDVKYTTSGIVESSRWSWVVGYFFLCKGIFFFGRLILTVIKGLIRQRFIILLPEGFSLCRIQSLIAIWSKHTYMPLTHKICDLRRKIEMKAVTLC